GEFDVSVLLEQFSGEKISLKLAPEWRGGAYYAARIFSDNKSAADGDAKSDTPKNIEPKTSSIALLYLSRWATPDAAQRFAGEYAKSLAKRYKSVKAEAAESRWMTDE